MSSVKFKSAALIWGLALITIVFPEAVVYSLSPEIMGKRFMKFNEAGYRFKISQQKFFIVTDNACPNFHIINRAGAEKGGRRVPVFR